MTFAGIMDLSNFGSFPKRIFLTVLLVVILSIHQIGNFNQEKETQI